MFSISEKSQLIKVRNDMAAATHAPFFKERIKAFLESILYCARTLSSNSGFELVEVCLELIIILVPCSILSMQLITPLTTNYTLKIK
jgi:hypothetical protein